jgi:hypothetical protein
VALPWLRPSLVTIVTVSGTEHVSIILQVPLKLLDYSFILGWVVVLTALAVRFSTVYFSIFKRFCNVNSYITHKMFLFVVTHSRCSPLLWPKSVPPRQHSNHSNYGKAVRLIHFKSVTCPWPDPFHLIHFYLYIFKTYLINILQPLSKFQSSAFWWVITATDWQRDRHHRCLVFQSCNLYACWIGPCYHDMILHQVANWRGCL